MRTMRFFIVALSLGMVRKARGETNFLIKWIPPKYTCAKQRNMQCRDERSVTLCTPHSQPLIPSVSESMLSHGKCTPALLYVIHAVPNSHPVERKPYSDARHCSARLLRYKPYRDFDHIHRTQGVKSCPRSNGRFRPSNCYLRRRSQEGRIVERRAFSTAKQQAVRCFMHHNRTTPVLC